MDYMNYWVGKKINKYNNDMPSDFRRSSDIPVT